MKNRLLYVMDPLCGWCYGYSAVMQQIQASYKDKLDFKVIPGGMMTGARVQPVSVMANYILQAYKQVEDYAGVKFGDPYLDMLREGSEISNSEPPCRAIYTFEQKQPGNSVDFAHKMQLKHYTEGKSLNDETTYRELASEFNLDPEEFVKEMASEDNKYGTQQELQWVQAAGINGFPCTILEKDNQYFLISRGFQPYEGVAEVLERALNS